MNLTFLGEYVPDQPRDTSGMQVFGLKKYYRQTTVLEIKATARLGKMPQCLRETIYAINARL